MTFEVLHSDTECNCICDALENTNLLFARKISKPSPKSGDFKTHWERNRRPNSESCNDICLHKGISINFWNNNSEEQIINKYVNTLKFQSQENKNQRDCILVFRFKKDAGLIKSSPTKNDPSHCTFFKSDSFNIDGIEEVKIIELKKYV